MHHGGTGPDHRIKQELPCSVDPRRFGRFFNFTEEQPSDMSLSWLGRPNGKMDGSAQGADPSNEMIPGGFTFFGQFIDHDITALSNEPPITEPHSLAVVRNLRDATLNLDSVYGEGPESTAQSADMYDTAWRFKMRENGKDLPRDPTTQKAIIGDPRNDENHLISQLQAAFLRAHNKIMDGEPGSQADAFNSARKKLIHTYQTIVLQEYLPLHVPADVLALVMNNQLGLYDSAYQSYGHAVMPVEFAAAAFRFGHSQVRAFYNVSSTYTGAPLFDPDDPKNLNGGRNRTAQEAVDWTLYFTDTPNNKPAGFNDTRRIDGTLAGPLFALRPPAMSNPPLSLAERNLLRGKAFNLISGQGAFDALVKAAGDHHVQFPGQKLTTQDQLKLPPVVFDPLVRNAGTPEEHSKEGEPVGVDEHTPLWYYILREAETVYQPGVYAGLGPVGGAIVAEVLVGLIRRDQGTNGGPNLYPVPSIENTQRDPLPGIDTMAKLMDFAKV